GRPSRSPGSWSCSAGRCAWHLPRRGVRSLDQVEAGLVLLRLVVLALARAGAVVPAALDVAADARAGGDGQGAGGDVADDHGGGLQLDPVGGFDIALELAGHGHALGAHATVEARAAVDGEVAFDVDVALELAGDADVAAAGNLALDGEVGGDDRFPGLRRGRRRRGTAGGLLLEGSLGRLEIGHRGVGLARCGGSVLA